MLALDEELTLSFDLDYEIFSTINTKYKPYSNFISSPKIESDDLLREFEKYVQVTNDIIEELLNLLQNCNQQRMNFRMILIKMLKDRVIVDKILKEENDTLILKKLVIHEELKNRIIDRNIDTIINSETEKNKLYSKINVMDQERKRSFSGAGSLNSTSCNSTINNSNVSFIQKKNSNVSLLNQKSNSNNCICICMPSKSNLSSNLNKSTCISCSKKFPILKSNTCTLSNSVIYTGTPFEDQEIKKVLNLDFNTEKYNIISSSPLQSPHSKINSTILGVLPKPALKSSFHVHAQANAPPHLYTTKKNSSTNNSIASPVRHVRTKSSLEKPSVSPRKKDISVIPCNNEMSSTKSAKRIRMKKYSKSIDFDASYPNIKDRYSTLSLNTSKHLNFNCQINEQEKIDGNYIQIDTEHDGYLNQDKNNDICNTYTIKKLNENVNTNPRSRMSYNDSAKKLDFSTITTKSSQVSNKKFKKLNSICGENSNSMYISNTMSSSTTKPTKPSAGQNQKKFNQGKLKSLVNSTKNYSSNTILTQSLSSFPSKESSKNFKF